MSQTWSFELWQNGANSGLYAYLYNEFSNALNKTSDGPFAAVGHPVLGYSMSPFRFLTNPNAKPPDAPGGSQLGLTPVSAGPGVVPYYASAYAVAGWESALPIAYVDSRTGVFADPTSNPFAVECDTVTVRYFLKKFTIKVEWTDGTTDVVVPQRPVYCGLEEAGWSGVQPVGALWLAQDVDTFSYTRGGGTPALLSLGAGNGIDPWQLTDASGICAYYALMGIGVGYAQAAISGGVRWILVEPNVRDDGGGVLETVQNVSLFQRASELAVPVDSGGAPGIYPIYVDEAHAMRQHLPGTADTDDTAGWNQHYTGAEWTSSTGVLSTTDPALQTFKYHQSATVNVVDSGGSAIPANVTLTGPGGSPVYTGTAGTAIPVLPAGSVLDGPPSTGAISSFPLVSASTYPSASGEHDLAHLCPPQRNVGVPLIPGTAPAPGQADRHDTHWTGKASDTLTGCAEAEETPTWGPVAWEDLDGGEVLTQPYAIAWTATDGSGRSGTGYIWVHEDDDETVTVTLMSGTGAGRGDLDYAVDPSGEPWLTAGSGASVLQYRGVAMERSHDVETIIASALYSPSRVVMPDHEHLLAGINSTGDVHLWRSTDTTTWTDLGTVDTSTAWTGCTMRTEPDGTLHLWLVNAAGMVKRRLSTDGGATWNTLAFATGFPTCRAERIDARWSGGEWVAIVADAGGSAELYTSPDGETWTHAVQVAAAGRFTWLTPLAAGDFAALYYDTGTANMECRRVGWDGGAWSVSSAVTVATP